MVMLDICISESCFHTNRSRGFRLLLLLFFIEYSNEFQLVVVGHVNISSRCVMVIWRYATGNRRMAGGSVWVASGARDQSVANSSATNQW